jgi:hypothetical protein
MEPRLTGINENEVLLYLGYKGGEIAPTIHEDIARCQEILMKTARPRIVWRQFDLREDGSLVGTDFRPQGKDIQNLLTDCHQAILMAATLGSEIEALVRRMQLTNMGDAVILDCCGSSAIENVCDNLCEDLQKEVDGFLTDRFSPGYGDFPFEQQPEFCRTLDVSRRIGVNLSPSGLMIPQKSVTALIGVADRPQTKRFRGCAYCGRFETCTFRKENKTCGRG